MERPNGDGWAHLVSDLRGESGRQELRAFLKTIGVRRPLHRSYTYAEHCDIRGTEISRAHNAGAQLLSWRGLARLLKNKRAQERAPARSAFLIPNP